MEQLKVMTKLKENLFLHLRKHPAERVAAGLLIVCLKLLFGFDDHAEHVIHDAVLKDQLLLPSDFNRRKPFKILHWIKQQRLREAVVFEGVPLARALSKSYLDAKLTVGNRLMSRWMDNKDIRRPTVNSELSELFPIALESEQIWRQLTIFPLKSLESTDFPILRVGETVTVDEENQKLFMRNHSRDLLLFPEVLAERLKLVEKTNSAVNLAEISTLASKFPCAHRYIMYWNSPGKELDSMGVGVPENFECLRLEFSLSFDWMLHFMARRIEDSPEILFSVVSDVEECLFGFKTTRLFRPSLNKQNSRRSEAAKN